MILGRPFVVETKEWQQWAQVYEPNTTNWVQKNLKKGDIVLDIGAHIGYYTLLFAELVGPEGKVYAFEPNPDVMKVLKYNVKTNEFNNVVFIEKLVSGYVGSRKLYIPEVTDAASVRPMEKVRKIVEVETINIDALNYSKIDLVKMDIEGSEYVALLGMSETLARNPDAKLIIEFCPTNLGEKNAKDLIQFLENYNIIGMDRNIVCERRN